jgi:hypothetical protein
MSLAISLSLPLLLFGSHAFSANQIFFTYEQRRFLSTNWCEQLRQGVGSFQSSFFALEK